MSKNYKDLTDQEIFDLYQKHLPKNMYYDHYICKGHRYTEWYKRIENDIENLEVFDDDIWITSFPKSGTTWMSEMVWALCNDLKSPAAKLPYDRRVRFLEYASLYNFSDSDNMDYVSKSVTAVDEMPRPRFIKSHNAWTLLPRQIREFEKRPKVIHVYRNPKDVAVSFYHHCKMFRGFFGELELFLEVFLRGFTLWSPYMDLVKSFWDVKDEPNVLLIKYEDMKADMRGILFKVAKFLNIEVSQERAEELMQHLSFDTMKKNDNLQIEDLAQYVSDKYLDGQAPGRFIRKGGSHKEEMSAETLQRFNAWLEKHAHLGINF